MEVQLSREEISVALLIESHDVACESLSGFVVHAAKAVSPDDWKDDICSFFGQGVKRHVLQRLQSGLPIKDIYALCKMIRCGIHDIARFCGESLATPRDKERLSLQVQGVETARNWTFHGQTISVREVCSSVCLLKNILATLYATRGKHSFAEDKLERILKQAAELAGCGLNGKYKQAITSDAVGRSLLSCSLTEFERKFAKLFTDGNEHSGEGIHTPGDAFSELTKQLQKAVPKMASQKKLNGYKVHECITMSKNILSARNALAHSGGLTLTTIKNRLSDIRNILCAFNISSEKTNSALHKLERLLRGVQEGKHVQFCLCVEQMTDRSSGSKDDVKDKQRILRPKGKLFVGRQEELTSIKQAFAKSNSPTRQRVMLLYGPAGIGKSYLAAELAHLFTNTYSRKTWLSCASVCELEQDLSQQSLLTTNSDVSAQPQDDMTTMALPFVEGGNLERDHLMVLDDVRTCTYQTVCDQFVKSDYTLIITTTSTVVKNCLQRDETQLYTVHLKPFTVAESWELLTSKTGKKREDEERKSLQKINETLCGVLGNLPLCVGIYSSLVDFQHKKKKREVIDLGKSPLKETWGDIERRFGDRFHVRGLTGVVECAESFLKNQPFSVFLLAKLCSVDCEAIPWKIVCSRYSQWWTVHGSKLVMEAWLRRLLSGLLGVIDWLFSDSGRTALEDCRSNLEELGLISWDSSTRLVSFHGLTFSSVKKMLKERCLFVGCLISAYVPRTRNFEAETLKVRIMLMEYVSNELLSDVLTEGVYVLRNAIRLESSDENRGLREVLLAFYFLWKFRRTVAPESCFVASRQGDAHFINLRDVISALLLDFSHFFALHVPLEDFICWHRSLDPEIQKKRLAKFEGSEEDKVDMTITLHYTEALLMYSRGLVDEALICLKTAQALLQTLSNTNSADIALHHSLLALMYQLFQGSEARKAYMEDAFQSCPRLLTAPSQEDIKHAVSCLNTVGYYGYINTRQPVLSFLWPYLVSYRAQHCLKSFGVLDLTTLPVVLLSIEFYQRSQASIMKEIARDETKKVSSARHYCRLATEVMHESNLWLRLKRYGLSLRALVKVYLVLEAHVLEEKNACAVYYNAVESKLWVHMDALLNSCVVRSWRVGHYSLGQIFLRRLLDNWPQKTVASDELPQSYSILQSNSPMAMLLESIGCLLPLAEAIEDLFEMKNTETTLEKLLSSIKKTSANKSLEFESMSACASLFSTPLAGVIVIWGCFLRDDSLSTTLNTFEGLSKGKETDPYLKDTFATISACLRKFASPQFELTKITQRLIDSKKALKKNERATARDMLFKCWEELAHLREDKRNFQTVIQDDVMKMLTVATKFVVEHLLLNVAQILQRIFVDDEEYDKAESFAKFRFQSARKLKGLWPFIAINCHMDFVEFLKNRGRFSEAQEQCCLVDQSLVEEFGEDYSEWLPNPPQARETLRVLHDKISSRKTTTPREMFSDKQH